MPRRPPSAIRAHQAAAPRGERSARQIPGISSRTRAAIARLEAQGLGTDFVAESLDQYKSFLRRRGRTLYLSPYQCPCCDPAVARDALELALRRLPPAARRDLGRLVYRLDEEYRRRTLPEPRPYRLLPWQFAAWWHQRMAGY
ncbi:hypothetical protein GCM10023074_23350 [Microbispora amethystogenes]|uniref:Uncharacterized protein n=1 Tax=Microbispora amethystogenes TaxID=1427754 RepID=A0ABQ4F8X8_9ACTN|nr:hypothetical protein Mam01_14440 [Microbispora amethystogenes]